jgi:hypothetical protein
MVKGGDIFGMVLDSKLTKQTCLLMNPNVISITNVSEQKLAQPYAGFILLCPL